MRPKSEPTIQNIPIRTERGRLIREVVHKQFVTVEHPLILNDDYFHHYVTVKKDEQETHYIDGKKIP